MKISSGIWTLQSVTGHGKIRSLQSEILTPWIPSGCRRPSWQPHLQAQGTGSPSAPLAAPGKGRSELSFRGWFRGCRWEASTVPCPLRSLGNLPVSGGWGSVCCFSDTTGTLCLSRRGMQGGVWANLPWRPLFLHASETESPWDAKEG